MAGGLLKIRDALMKLFKVQRCPLSGGAQPAIPGSVCSGIPKSVEWRTTRAGDKAVRITRPDGSVIDISPKRAKEYIPETHPNAPPGTLRKVRFPNALPGSKGFKRTPTPDELSILKDKK